MVAVMIGVDPHKGSHPAVVISPGEEPLGEIRIRACAAQAGNLVAWAADWAERTWAVEGAAGLGRLLVQQLVAGTCRIQTSMDVSGCPSRTGVPLRSRAGGQVVPPDPIGQPGRA